MELIPRIVTSRPNDLHESDRALVRAILEGSTEAWHEFVRRYSRLILSVIHRYVPRYRAEEARTLYVGVLERLYRVKLSGYEGRATLATWVVLVTRSAVVDDLRQRLGGRDLHAALKALTALQREVFQHYYVEGLSFGEVRAMVRDDGAPLTVDRLLAVLQSLEERLQGRLARRLRYDLHSQSVGGASGRLLEYLDHARLEFEQRADGASVDHEAVDREARRTLERIHAELEQLPAEERNLLMLRFERGWTAERIANELGLPGQRRVYTWLDRILRVLRRRLRDLTEPMSGASTGTDLTGPRGGQASVRREIPTRTEPGAE